MTFAIELFTLRTVYFGICSLCSFVKPLSLLGLSDLQRDVDYLAVMAQHHGSVRQVK